MRGRPRTPVTVTDADKAQERRFVLHVYTHALLPLPPLPSAWYYVFDRDGEEGFTLLYIYVHRYTYISLYIYIIYIYIHIHTSVHVPACRCVCVWVRVYSCVDVPLEFAAALRQDRNLLLDRPLRLLLSSAPLHLRCRMVGSRSTGRVYARSRVVACHLTRTYVVTHSAHQGHFCRYSHDHNHRLSLRICLPVRPPPPPPLPSPIRTRIHAIIYLPRAFFSSPPPLHFRLPDSWRPSPSPSYTPYAVYAVVLACACVAWL